MRFEPTNGHRANRTKLEDGVTLRGDPKLPCPIPPQCFTGSAHQQTNGVYSRLRALANRRQRHARFQTAQRARARPLGRSFEFETARSIKSLMGMWECSRVRFE